MPTYYDSVACENVSGTERIFRLLAYLDPADPAAVERTGAAIGLTINEMSSHERSKLMSGLMLMMNDLRLRVAVLEARLNQEMINETS